MNESHIRAEGRRELTLTLTPAPIVVVSRHRTHHDARLWTVVHTVAWSHSRRCARFPCVALTPLAGWDLMRRQVYGYLLVYVY